MDRTRTLEIAAATLLAFLAALAVLVYKPFPLMDDGIVYLNVADNLRQGHGASTTIIHYDTERNHGRIPAPITTFPPGYPVMAMLMGSSEPLVRIVSVLCFSGTAALLMWALQMAGVPFLFRMVAVCLLVTNAASLRYATAIMSESLFTFLAFASLACILWAERSPRRAPVVYACVAIALAYTVRYAALFLIPPVVGYALYRAWVDGLYRPLEDRWQLALSSLVPLGVAGAFMVRNVLLVGDWRGGNDLPVVKSIGTLASDFSHGQLHLLFGEHKLSLGAWEIGLCAAVVLVLLGLRSSHRTSSYRDAALVGLWVLLYAAAFLYAARGSVVDLDSRMFVPMVPCYVLLFGLLMAHDAVPALFTTGLVAMVLCYAAINARDLYVPDAPARSLVLANLLAQPMADGRPPREWVDRHAAIDEAVFAADGQATAHVLRRPVVSMVPATYSALRWTCPEIRKQMARFGARYWIVYRGPAQNDVDDALPKEARAVTGSPAACGFTVAAENAGVSILTIGPLR